ncbi:MAG: NAD+ synthase, partial [Nitrospirae bacterium]|nr:NAD+ synthase [Nitrospirota bacterium]
GEGKAEVILNISASPYHVGKGRLREKVLSERARENCAMVFYNNLVGGQDELVFDGGGMVFDQKGKEFARGKQFEEDLVIVDLNAGRIRNNRLRHESRPLNLSPLGIALLQKVKKIELPEAKTGKKKSLPERKIKKLGRLEEIYRALILGVHDYVKKNGFKKVVIGLSGGIDSSLAAVLAVDALGRENVTGLSMPSAYSSAGTQADTVKLARNLGIKLITIPIDEIFRTYLEALREKFQGLKPDVTEENLQARIRGNILMAISNKYGSLVLTTGNKSEMSVGYCTLYGDMAGGFAVIKDVPKTLVYKLSRYRNRKEGKSLIPKSVLDREPSAELRPNQKDADTLPPYSLLDPILEAYVEEDKSSEEIIAGGFNPRVVKKVIRMVDRNEYKRRQGPLGVKITPRAFGKDRRFPLTNRYQDF